MAEIEEMEEEHAVASFLAGGTVHSLPSTSSLQLDRQEFLERDDDGQKGEAEVDELEEEEEVRSDAPTLSSKGSDTEEGKGRRRWPPIRGEDYDDLSARLNAPTATKECVVPRIGTKQPFEVLQSTDGGEGIHL